MMARRSSFGELSAAFLAWWKFSEWIAVNCEMIRRRMKVEVVWSVENRQSAFIKR